MNKLFVFFTIILIWGCTTEDRALPILGEKLVDPISGDTTYYKAPDFDLTNQLNKAVSSDDYAGHIQVVDFFFTSCPTICPQMTSHLKLVEEAFAHESEVALLSFSIDSRNDTPEKLMKYADKYDADHAKWSFLTGSADDIFELAKDYKVRAFDDSFPDSESNLIHDGTFVLVDGQRRIRGYYNGLERTDTQRLITDIKKLLN